MLDAAAAWGDARPARALALPSPHMLGLTGMQVLEGSSQVSVVTRQKREARTR